METWLSPLSNTAWTSFWRMEDDGVPLKGAAYGGFSQKEAFLNKEVSQQEALIDRVVSTLFSHRSIAPCLRTHFLKISHRRRGVGHSVDGHVEGERLPKTVSCTSRRNADDLPRKPSGGFVRVHGARDRREKTSGLDVAYLLSLMVIHTAAVYSLWCSRCWNERNNKGPDRTC